MNCYILLGLNINLVSCNHLRLAFRVLLTLYSITLYLISFSLIMSNCLPNSVVSRGDSCFRLKTQINSNKFDLALLLSLWLLEQMLWRRYYFTELTDFPKSRKESVVRFPWPCTRMGQRNKPVVFFSDLRKHAREIHACRLAWHDRNNEESNILINTGTGGGAVR